MVNHAFDKSFKCKKSCWMAYKRLNVDVSLKDDESWLDRRTLPILVKIVETSKELLEINSLFQWTMWNSD